MQKTFEKEKCCLICGEKLAFDPTCFGLFRSKYRSYCGKCQKKFVPSPKAGVLYEYNDFFRSLLFRYKALGDLALAPVFLETQAQMLHKRYHDYIIVVVPSNHEDDLRRGFATLPWIFKSLRLPIISPFYKRIPYKQSTSKHREDIYEVIGLKNHLDVRQKKLLLVDDVMTSGHTLKACVALLEKFNPACIDILVLAAKQEKER